MSAMDRDPNGVVTVVSSRTVPDTVARLIDLLRARDLKLFAVIDQSAEARTVGQELRDTVLVVFGSPAAGTPVMNAAPLAALDLPLKLLVWADRDGTKVSYLAPDVLADRHHLPVELVRNLAGITPLAEALVAP